MTAPRPGQPPHEDLTDKVFRVGGELAYICLLSALWLLLAWPIVTLPAATVGVYATLVAHLEDGSREYVRPFWDAFRASFRTVTLPGLLLVAVAGLAGFNSYYYLVVQERTAVTIALAVVQVLLAAVAIALASYLFGLAGRFHVRGAGGRPPGLRQAATSAAAAPGWSLLIIAVTAGVPAVLAWLSLWQFAPFVIGTVCYANTRLLLRALGEAESRR